jgi:chromosome segregation ATPase
MLNGELHQVCNARDKLQSEVQECDRQISQLNEFIRSKDEEKHQLLVNYRKLISEYERMDIQYRSSVEETNNLRMEIISRDKRIQGLDRQLDLASQELNKFKIDLNAHEKQHSNLSKALSTAERQVKQLEIDKQRLSREIQSAREVAHSIDRNKDGLQGQLLQITLEHDKLLQQINKMNLDKESIEKQLTAERLKSERFELMLNTERTRQIQNEKSNMDMKVSQNQLEHQLQNLNEQQALALNSTKSQLAQSVKEIEMLKQRIVQLENILKEHNECILRLM